MRQCLSHRGTLPTFWTKNVLGEFSTDRISFYLQHQVMLHPEKCARTYPGAKKQPTKPVRVVRILPNMSSLVSLVFSPAKNRWQLSLAFLVSRKPPCLLNVDNMQLSSSAIFFAKVFFAKILFAKVFLPKFCLQLPVALIGISPHTPQQVSKFSKSRESSVTFLESTDDEAEDKKSKARNHTNF